MGEDACGHVPFDWGKKATLGAEAYRDKIVHRTGEEFAGGQVGLVGVGGVGGVGGGGGGGVGGLWFGGLQFKGPKRFTLPLGARSREDANLANSVKKR